VKEGLRIEMKVKENVTEEVKINAKNIFCSVLRTYLDAMRRDIAILRHNPNANRAMHRCNIR